MDTIIAEVSTIPSAPSRACQTVLSLSELPASRTEVRTLVLAAASCTDDAPGAESRARVLTDGVDTSGLDVEALEGALADLGYTAGLDAVLRLPAQGLGEVAAPSLLVVGTGQGLERAEDAASDAVALGSTRSGVLARAAARAVRELAGTDTAVLALPAADASDLEAVARGAASGGYSWAARVPAATAPLGEAVIPSGLTGSEGEQALARASVLGGALRLTRDLVNEPPNRLTPQAFAQLAQELADEAGLEVEVLDEAALAEGGFGGIVGVGQGSVHPPRLVRVSWVPASPSRRVALIGKGVTFDSGGLSLKPPASMPEMKSDMAGAATVLATVLAAVGLRLDVRVDAWLALAENMPTADAQRPSDIVTMYGGTTVEITNTDAEGRLVMADALARAVEDEPDAVLDVATLTGAQIVALGDRVSGVMGTPSLRQAVTEAAVAAGEAFWAMPLPEHLRANLDSPFARLRNASVGSRAGGMLVAGLFLREFVGQVPWAHLDVAGPAYNEKSAWGGVPVGGTGAGVATLVELLRSMAR
ncbi:leucyl aminopeptidase [Actinomyces faecalis]|uniref:leucyl aminopeptidase n=1 Tax=Actinomyces faecalis TaxID=2722820 RepID=UPI001555CB42